MIIALTGPMAAGKTEAGMILKEQGFQYIAFSDIIRKIADERKIEPTRQNLQKLGRKVKEEANNQGILSKLIVDHKKKDNLVADGLRNPDELREFKKYPGFLLVAVTAPMRVRYARIRKRKRPGDPENYIDFRSLDRKENRGESPAQDINRCVRAADLVIENNGTIQELKDKVQRSIVQSKKLKNR